jgi:hypothetical protein
MKLLIIVEDIPSLISIFHWVLQMVQPVLIQNFIGHFYFVILNIHQGKIESQGVTQCGLSGLVEEI